MSHENKSWINSVALLQLQLQIFLQIFQFHYNYTQKVSIAIIITTSKCAINYIKIINSLQLIQLIFIHKPSHTHSTSGLLRGRLGNTAADYTASVSLILFIHFSRSVKLLDA